MNKLTYAILLVALVLLPIDAAAASLQTTVDNWFSPFSQAFSDLVFTKFSLFGHSIPLIVLWLACAALFFTFYLGFINIRAFPYAVKLVKGNYDLDNKTSGEISHFQALATAISGTVGIGNIGGVAVAIGIGGPGAAFWNRTNSLVSSDLQVPNSNRGSESFRSFFFFAPSRHGV